MERELGKEVGLKTTDYQSFEKLLEDAAAQLGPFDAICMGVAGPVEEGKPILLPLVDWPAIHLEKVVKRFSLKSARLVNDMVAIAHGISAKHRASGSPAGAKGNYIAVTIGTSVGKIRCADMSDGLQCFPSEACHTILPVGTREHSMMFDKICAEFGLAYPLNCSEIISGVGLERLFWALTGKKTPIGEIAGLGASNVDFIKLG
jgi:glucokinase